MKPANSNRKAPLRVLVALASYGTSNDRYLERVVQTYRSMPFDVDIVVVSNIQKNVGPGVECLVGLPDKNPWSLPFAHKKLFVERAHRYDLFVYSEDDILITEKNLEALLHTTAVLNEDEIAGFLRNEKGAGGAVNYPDVHGCFHWDPTSVRTRGQYVLAKFTNEHAAGYALTQAQLIKAIGSGGFDVPPHEGRYDLLCAAATDPYTQCGFTKLIPISHLDAFTVHHLSNKYVGQVGVSAPELNIQVTALLRLARDGAAAAPLLTAETKLWRGMYCKEYYEGVCDEVVAMIPPSARSVLSIGCGWGATEALLVRRGLQAAALPLDAVIGSSAAARGIEIIRGDFRAARAALGRRRFDCVMYLNVLHLVPDPAEVLSLFKDVSAAGTPIIIQSPNMRCIPAIWKHARGRPVARWTDYESAGAHFTTVPKIHDWCRRAGLVVEQDYGILHRRAGFLRAAPGGIAALSMSPKFICVTRRAEDYAKSPRQGAEALGSLGQVSDEGRRRGQGSLR
jgi:2-polyprenyl-3-methyl-5-hydroxy-6-metoxy-1,4-benzoquinol methylase